MILGSPHMKPLLYGLIAFSSHAKKGMEAVGEDKEEKEEDGYDWN